MKTNKTISNIIQNKVSFKKITKISRKKHLFGVDKKIKKISLLFLHLIIININTPHIFSPHLQYSKNMKDIKVCLCIVGKKENLYAEELVNHYKSLGYNHIFIYDNNDIGEEKFDDVLYKQINNSFVTTINFRGFKQPQCRAYRDCYEKNKNNYDWLSFFDFDEFLYITNNKSIQEFLSDERYKKCINVKINTLYYTDNDLIYYENKSLNERFTSYKIDYYPNIHIKSTVRGYMPKNYWSTYTNPHTSTVRYTSCNSLGKKIPFDTPFNQPNYKFAYLKHYSMKTLEEFCSKVMRGYPDRKSDFSKDYWTKRFKEFFMLNKKTKEKLEFIKNTYQIDL